MEQERRVLGYGLAGLGSTGVVASLWLPWYGFQIPGTAIDQAVQTAHRFGVLGPLVHQGAELLRQLGPLHVTAWQVFTVTPAVLLAVGVVAGGLSALALTGRATGVARVVARVGVCAIALAVYRIVARPGQGDLLRTAWGLYLALIAGGAVLAGGLIAAAGERAEARAPLALESPEAAPTPVAWSTAHSVAPPTP